MGTKKGLFITFDGIDHSGKSTQARMFLEKLKEKNIPVILIRDPGTTKISEKIRAILLDNENEEMDPTTELLLYEAARSQMVSETIKPILATGKFVVCDRFFDSTTAYQGYGRGIDLELIKKANELGSKGLIPDLTFIIDINVEEAEQRKLSEQTAKDRLESTNLDFKKRVREGFLTIGKTETRAHIIKSAEEIQQTADKIWQIANSLLNFEEMKNGKSRPT